MSEGQGAVWLSFLEPSNCSDPSQLSRLELKAVEYCGILPQMKLPVMESVATFSYLDFNGVFQQAVDCTLGQPYKCVESLGGRVVGELVYHEGQFIFKAANITQPIQHYVSGIPMRLNSPVIQTVYSNQNSRNAIPPQIPVQIQALQGFLKVPSNKLPPAVCNSNYQLSNVRKDNHQAIFDNTKPTVSSCNPSQLACLKSTEDGMMMNIPIDSHQMPEEIISQPKEETCNKWKKFIRPHIQRRVPIRRAPQAVPDPVPQRKRTTPINPAYTVRKSRVSHSVHTRPFRDRVIHLLALRDYKKSELLIRLQKDSSQINDRDSLENILQEVAHLNTSNLSYTLNDDVFKEIQKDWPGYNDIDRQSLELVLSLKADPSKNAIGSSNSEPSTLSTTDDASFSDKQLFNSVSVSTLVKKKVRISHLTTMTRSTSNTHLNKTSGNSSMSLLPLAAATDKPVSPPLSAAHFNISNTTQLVNSNNDSCSTEGQPETQDSYVDSLCRSSSIFESQPKEHTSSEMVSSVSTQTQYPNFVEKKHSKLYKSKHKSAKHKAKRPKHHTDMTRKHQTDSTRRGEEASLNSSLRVEDDCTASEKTFETSEIPDYLTKYFTIASYEQRYYYEQEFRAEYDEYQALHAKMLTLSSIFLDLDSKRKCFPPDSKEYQDTNKEIALEYRKLRQRNPCYQAEKQRCLYLYNKLVHIKKLVNDFDQQKINREH
ncbi:RNA polymerase II elongation factor ELL2-like [Lepus europaeus]|uniref:RNA polymerase II elongation factor ELL2-like n=1 Tax=Lepus europaeus TaxID=9983 RepID=UPI002B461F5D|nr:RNA polymerase II elongation factor ELL2-like [Lepus europaeus]